MIAALALLGCRDRGLTAEQLRDPASCEACHPDHVRQWSGSMHAYATDDPVFQAMNARGQRETDGALGTFCVQCHAPAAVALGYAADGDVADLPDELRGVTCWFCHRVAEVAGAHENNPLTLLPDDDLDLLGPFSDPVPNEAHPAGFSALLDRDDPSSAALCGSCHDIVTGAGGHIERTYAEWQSSVFSRPAYGDTCDACHLVGHDGVAAQADGVKLRRVHDHTFPGLDLALTDFPEREAQAAAVQDFLDDGLNAFLCVSDPVDGATSVRVTLENVKSGHYAPSGAAADRRMWVELRAFQGATPLYASGAEEPDAPIGTVTDATDPDLWRMWSTMLDADGQPTHDFWKAADLDVGGVLPVVTTLDASDPAFVDTHVRRTYTIPGVPDRVTVAVRVTPIGREILDDLVATGDLDPSVVDEVPTLTPAATELTWDLSVPANDGAWHCLPEAPPPPVTGGTTP